MILQINIWLNNYSFTVCYILKEGFLFTDKYVYKIVGVKSDLVNVELKEQIHSENKSKDKKKCLKFRSNGLFLQPFVRECINSDVYRCNVLKYLDQLNKNSNKEIIFLKLILEPPDKEIIDYAWNMRMLQLVWMKVEIDNAFSWLSTLGGAYSALGDYFDNCAEEAGKISITQYKLSKMLGDDSLAARSKLYSAIAFAQKGKLKISRYIVRDVAQFARTIKDVRLNRMCQGIWAKLRYLRHVQNGVNS